jgi:NH3-dependent NAD+ synthetase
MILFQQLRSSSISRTVADRIRRWPRRSGSRDGAAGVAPALAMKVERLVRASEHKRAMPPVPEFD